MTDVNKAKPASTMDAEPRPLAAVAESRQTISISLAKKSKKSKSAASKLQLQSAEEEFSTIAEQAVILSKKRAEEGQILVIPCNQKRDEGQPLLAQRSVQYNSAQDVGVANTERNPIHEEDDEEATRLLIESATHRDDNINTKTSGLTIAAPQQNTLNTPKAAIAKSSTTDDELFRRDLSSRAEDVDPTSNTYANISIGDFGGALLRGMGWKGGDTNKKEKDEMKARPHRLGLGATPLLPPPTGKHGRARRPEELKKEEERLKAEEEREKKRLEMERLDVQYTLQKNSIIRLLEGGRAKVVQTAGVPGLNRILVRLENGKDESVSKGSVKLCSWDELEKNPFVAKVKIDNHADIKERDARKRDSSKCDERKQRDPNESIHGKNGRRGDDYYDDDRYDKKKRKQSSRDRDYSDDDRRYKRKQKDSSRDKYYSDDDDSRYKKRRKESSRDKRRKKDRGEEGDSSRSRNKHRDKGEGDDRKDKNRDRSGDHRQEHLNWLLPNIRIRLISKKYPHQHLRKGVVQDVISSQNNNPKAVILMDNQEVLDNIPERYLETALPKTGGNVIVLEGIHRWKKGRLLERSSERSSGIIQLFEDLEVVDMSLDVIAEWCGPLDEDME